MSEVTILSWQPTQHQTSCLGLRLEIAIWIVIRHIAPSRFSLGAIRILIRTNGSESAPCIPDVCLYPAKTAEERICLSSYGGEAHPGFRAGVLNPMLEPSSRRHRRRKTRKSVFMGKKVEAAIWQAWQTCNHNKTPHQYAQGRPPNRRASIKHQNTKTPTIARLKMLKREDHLRLLSQVPYVSFETISRASRGNQHRRNRSLRIKDCDQAG